MGRVVTAATRPDRFTPGNYPVLTVWEAGWAPGKVWTRAENSPLPELDPRTFQPTASRL